MSTVDKVKGQYSAEQLVNFSDKNIDENPNWFKRTTNSVGKFIKSKEEPFKISAAIGFASAGADFFPKMPNLDLNNMGTMKALDAPTPAGVITKRTVRPVTTKARETNPANSSANAASSKPSTFSQAKGIAGRAFVYSSVIHILLNILSRLFNSFAPKIGKGWCKTRGNRSEGKWWLKTLISAIPVAAAAAITAGAAFPLASGIVRTFGLHSSLLPWIIFGMGTAISIAFTGTIKKLIFAIPVIGKFLAKWSKNDDQSIKDAQSHAIKDLKAIKSKVNDRISELTKELDKQRKKTDKNFEANYEQTILEIAKLLEEKSAEISQITTRAANAIPDATSKEWKSIQLHLTNVPTPEDVAEALRKNKEDELIYGVEPWLESKRLRTIESLKAIAKKNNVADPDRYLKDLGVEISTPVQTPKRVRPEQHPEQSPAM